eukprot:bmy_18768T0
MWFGRFLCGVCGSLVWGFGPVLGAGGAHRPAARPLHRCPLRRRGRGRSRCRRGPRSPCSALPLCLGSRLLLRVAAHSDQLTVTFDSAEFPSSLFCKLLLESWIAENFSLGMHFSVRGECGDLDINRTDGETGIEEVLIPKHHSRKI